MRRAVHSLLAFLHSDWEDPAFQRAIMGGLIAALPLRAIIFWLALYSGSH
jgi:hypothetical protein